MRSSLQSPSKLARNATSVRPRAELRRDLQRGSTVETDPCQSLSRCTLGHKGLPPAATVSQQVSCGPSCSSSWGSAEAHNPEGDHDPCHDPSLSRDPDLDPGLVAADVPVQHSHCSQTPAGSVASELLDSFHHHVAAQYTPAVCLPGHAVLMGL